MGTQNPPSSHFRPRDWALIIGLPVLGLTVFFAVTYLPLFSSGGADDPKSSPVAEATPKQVHDLCARCHKYPPPDSFARADWDREVRQGYEFFTEDGGKLSEVPPVESVIKYYQKRAPEHLPLLRPQNAPDKPPVTFACTHYNVPEQPNPTIANVNLVHLFDDKKLDVLVCDMRDGWVTAFRPYTDPPSSVVLARLSHPVHAEVVDLDGDGIKDVLVAELGTFYGDNDNELRGQVVLLKGEKGGTFRPITLLKGVGRVADVQAADFKGKGKKDLVVAVFGWRKTGEILYLENQTTDWSNPHFKRHVLDERHGAIHVPIADINKDGKLDFVALISQEHETVVAFLGDGKGHFQKKTIWTGPHPAYGSSGIQLVDLNNDGRLDVLYTNGDVMGTENLRPFHSVQWLENKGTFPFTHHHLTSMYGVHRAVAADLRGQRVMDIIAVGCLPEEIFGEERQRHNLDSVILLEQTSRGKFVRHSLEKGTCDHATCALGSLNGDGRIDLVTGNFYLKEQYDSKRPAFTIWKNLGPPRKPAPTGRSK